MGKNSNDKLCIMIIPGTDKVKRLTIPSWLPKAILIAIALIFLSVVLAFNNIYSSYEDLKEMYNVKTTEIDELKRQNEDKNAQISNLKAQTNMLYEKSAEIDNKLAEIDKLQRQLEKMAGIQSTSRGEGIAKYNKLQAEDSVDRLQVLMYTLDSKEKELQNFIADMEERFEYLEAVPDLWPTSGRVTSRFGTRKDPFYKGTAYHEGIDIANSVGTDIVASAKGTVIFAGYKRGYGKVIIINHGNGYETLYGHNSKLLVSAGDKVEKGQVIAKMGNTGRSTGSHLHFEVRKDGKLLNPLNILK